MASEFVVTTLGDVCRQQGGAVQTGPFGSQLHASDYEEIGTPVVMPVNLVDGNVSESGIARVRRSHVERLQRHRLKAGDIVFSRRGDVTRFALISQREEGWLCGTGCLKVSVGRPEIATPEYLAALLASPDAKEWLIRHAVGATMPNLNTEILGNLPATLPPIKEQVAIGSFLRDLKQRIDLLRQTNATLEAIAQALFKSWFVDFDPVRAKAEGREPEGMDAETAALFPSEFDNSELGRIPKGWNTQSLFDTATFVNGAAYKALSPNSERRGLPIVKIAELKSGITPQTAFSDVEMPLKYHIDTGAALFSWSGNPDTSIDTFVWSRGPALLNQHIFCVVPKSASERSRILVMLKLLRPQFAEIARNKQTTGLGHVTVADLKEMRVVLPPPPIAESWGVLVDPIVERSLSNQITAQTLESLRDCLLPCLISGKLRLPEAEALIEDAAA